MEMILDIAVQEVITLMGVHHHVFRVGATTHIVNRLVVDFIGLSVADSRPKRVILRDQQRLPACKTHPTKAEQILTVWTSQIHLCSRSALSLDNDCLLFYSKCSRSHS